MLDRLCLSRRAGGAKRQIDLWTGWIAGALLEADLEATVVAAGFVRFAITWRADAFSGAPQASSAASFGTVGINVHVRKAASEEEWADALSALSCAREPDEGALAQRS